MSDAAKIRETVCATDWMNGASAVLFAPVNDSLAPAIVFWCIPAGLLPPW